MQGLRVVAGAVEQLGLQHVERVGIGVAQLDGLLDPGLILQQIPARAQFQHHLDGFGELLTQLLAKAPQLFGHQTGVIILGKPGVRFQEHHLQHLETGAEEGPLGTHLRQHALLAAIDGLLQPLVGTEPGRQHQAVLGPGEDPRNGAQTLDAAVGLALGRTGTERQLAELHLRSSGTEVGHEVRMTTHDTAVVFAGVGGQLLHHLAPALLRLGRRQQVPLQHGAGVELQALDGHLGQTELEADHLPLLCGTQPPAQGSRRLGEDRLVSRRTATTDGTAAAMEQGEANVVGLGQPHQRLHGGVLGPARGHHARILGRVGVADHHVLATLDIAAIPVHRQQARHHGSARHQVILGLEQRGDRHAELATDLFEQQLHRQHVGGGSRHGDDVDTERIRVVAGDHLAGIQGLAGLGTRLPVVGNERAAGVQFVEQEGLLVILAPLGVITHAQIAGQFGEDLAVALAILTDVQLDQMDAEAGDLAQHVQQHAVGDVAHTAGMQGVIAEFQRLAQLGGSLDEIAALAHLTLHLGGQVFLGFAQRLAQLAHQGAVGLGMIPYPLAHGLGAIGHGELGGELLDVLVEQAHRHPAAQLQHFGGHLSGDEGVAVAVTAHPGGELDRRGIQRQPHTQMVLQALVQIAHEFGNGRPQAVFYHGKAPLGFVHRRRTLLADLVGVPGLIDQLFDAIEDLVSLAWQQVRELQRLQAVVELHMLVDQGATGYLGGVRSQHQIDIQLAHRLDDGLLRQVGGFQLVEHQLQRIRGAGLLFAATGDGVELFCHVGQIEELAEGAGHRQQLVVGEGAQGIEQTFPIGLIALAGGLGQLANGFDLVEEGLTLMILDGLAQQLTQHAYVGA